MYPSFEIFGFDVHFYSIFFMLALLASGIYFIYGNKELRKYKEQLFDCFLYLVVGIILGAKLMYILVNIKDYVGNITRLWTDLRGGFLFYGGFIGACIAVYFYFRKNKLPVLDIIDSAATALPLGHAIGRIGCIFAGCCYGSPTNLPWGITYPASCPIAPGGISLHPAPIYEIILNLLLFAIILLVRKRVKLKGAIMSIYLIGYSIQRFIVEFFRDDYEAVFLNLTVAQLTSILIFAVAIGYYFIIKKVNNNSEIMDKISLEALEKAERLEREKADETKDEEPKDEE